MKEYDLNFKKKGGREGRMKEEEKEEKEESV